MAKKKAPNPFRKKLIDGRSKSNLVIVNKDGRRVFAPAKGPYYTLAIEDVEYFCQELAKVPPAEIDRIWVGQENHTVAQSLVSDATLRRMKLRTRKITFVIFLATRMDGTGCTAVLIEWGRAWKFWSYIDDEARSLAEWNPDERSSLVSESNWQWIVNSEPFLRRKSNPPK